MQGYSGTRAGDAGHAVLTALGVGALVPHESANAERCGHQRPRLAAVGRPRSLASCQRPAPAAPSGTRTNSGAVATSSSTLRRTALTGILRAWSTRKCRTERRRYRAIDPTSTVCARTPAVTAAPPGRGVRRRVVAARSSSCPLPPAEVVDGLPGREVSRQLTPRAARPDHIQDRIHDRTSRVLLRPPARFDRRQQRLDQLPLLVGQVRRVAPSTSHRLTMITGRSTGTQAPSKLLKHSLRCPLTISEDRIWSTLRDRFGLVWVRRARLRATCTRRRSLQFVPVPPDQLPTTPDADSPWRAHSSRRIVELGPAPDMANMHAT
jgi:hypothetical protein